MIEPTFIHGSIASSNLNGLNFGLLGILFGLQLILLNLLLLKVLLIQLTVLSLLPHLAHGICLGLRLYDQVAKHLYFFTTLFRRLQLQICISLVTLGVVKL